MRDKVILMNNLREVRAEKKMSQGDLADMVGVSRNAICSIEKGQYSPTATLALSLCIALEVKFEELFYFEGYEPERQGEGANLDTISGRAVKKMKEYLADKGWSEKEILDFIIYLVD